MAASASESASKVSLKLKLLIDKEEEKVLFAEAGKDTVDFLFTILSLPVSTVVRLLNKQQMVGCLGNLYDSVESLGEEYIQPNQNKDNILKPKTPIGTTDNVPLLMLDYTTPTRTKRFYKCAQCCYGSYGTYVSDREGVSCPGCRRIMSALMAYVDGGGSGEAKGLISGAVGEGGGGFVKGVVTYMVMDDLVVKPMSTISSITLFNQLNVKALEEKNVYLDMPKGLKVLKESMNSKNVLTNVFIGNKINDKNQGPAKANAKNKKRKRKRTS